MSIGHDIETALQKHISRHTEETKKHIRKIDNIVLTVYISYGIILFMSLFFAAHTYGL